MPRFVHVGKVNVGAHVWYMLHGPDTCWFWSVEVSVTGEVNPHFSEYKVHPYQFEVGL